MVQDISELLRVYHPNGLMWVNAQQYSQDNLTALMAALDSQVRTVVHPKLPRAMIIFVLDNERA